MIMMTTVFCRANTEGESRTGSGNIDQRLGSNSPSQQQQSMDPNNAAYLALRNHPETTIRPINSGAGEMRTEDNNEQSPRNMEENIFKQVSIDIASDMRNHQQF